MPINYPNLIAAIDAEISRLQQVRKVLSGSGTGTRTRRRKRGVMSAEGRARISAAMKKRWAQQRKAARR
jgi:hypothetical protein